jgi:hypothetical protein
MAENGMDGHSSAYREIVYSSPGRRTLAAVAAKKPNKSTMILLGGNIDDTV